MPITVVKMYSAKGSGVPRARVRDENGNDTLWEWRGFPLMWECVRGRSHIYPRVREYVRVLNAYYRNWNPGQGNLL